MYLPAATWFILKEPSDVVMFPCFLLLSPAGAMVMLTPISDDWSVASVTVPVILYVWAYVCVATINNSAMVIILLSFINPVVGFRLLVVWLV